jgi:uncharacterized protein YndB with AHSA1/START domain
MTTRDTQDLGTYQRLDDGRFRLRFERHLRHAPDRVWAALTDPAELERWFGPAEIDLRQGGTITLFKGADELFSRGEVTEVDPPRLLEHTSDVFGLLRWELEPEGDGTRLVFVATTAMGEEWLTRTLAGWHAILDQLATGLAGDPAEDEPQQWETIHHRYVEIHGGREWTMDEASAEGEAERLRRRASS